MARQYRFYGWQTADIPPLCPHPLLGSPRELYDLLSKLWSKDTCAPRLQAQWCAQNPSLGQCSITAFLAQDLFGGEVRGILLPDGNYHCYNVVSGRVFDLTSEQFRESLRYGPEDSVQLREAHFSKAEKLQRYELLKARLSACLRI